MLYRFGENHIPHQARSTLRVGSASTPSYGKPEATYTIHFCGCLFLWLLLHPQTLPDAARRPPDFDHQRDSYGEREHNAGVCSALFLRRPYNARRDAT